MSRNTLTIYGVAMAAATVCVAAVVYLAPDQGAPSKVEGASPLSSQAQGAQSPRMPLSAQRDRRESAKTIAMRKIDALASDLWTLRSQIEIYRVQHLDKWPTRDIVAQLSRRTNSKGKAIPNGADPKDYPFGPYILRMPRNPFAGSNAVVTGTGLPPAGQAGWYYNVKTGKLSPNDPGHKDL